MKKIFCSFFVSVFSFFILVNSSFSQSGYSDNLGNFLRFGGGARAMSMAGAYTALSDEGTAVFWNPAGLSQIDQLHLQFMYNNLFIEGASYSFFSTAYPTYGLLSADSKTTFGFGWAGMNSGSFDRRDIGGNKIGTFSESRNAFLFPVSYDYISDIGRLSFGARYIYFTHNFADYSASGSEFDVGFLGHFLNLPKWTLLGILPISKIIPWRFGLLFRFPGSEQLKDFQEKFPSSMHLGISYSAPQLPRIPGRLVFAYEFNKIFGDYSNSSASFLGTEYQYSFGKGKYISSIRGGYKPNAGDNQMKYTFGVGGGIRLSKIQVNFDYALSSHPVLRNNSTFFVTLQLRPQKNSVENFKTATDLTSMSKKNLIRTLLKYPLDPNIITGQSKDGTQYTYNDSLFSYYKDGELDDTINSGIAEKLSENYTPRNDSSASRQDSLLLADRYDEFAGGIKKLKKRFSELLEQYRFQYLKSSSKDFEKEWNELGAVFDRRKNKFKKERNIVPFHMYKQTLLLRDKKEDNITNKANTDNSFYDFFESGYNNVDSGLNISGELNKALGDSLDNESAHFYFLFLKGIKNGSFPEELTQANTFMPNSLPPFPLMYDGLLQDDIELLQLCFQNTLDSQTARKQILKVAYKFPYTTAANIIGKFLTQIRTAGDLNAVCKDIVDDYKNWFRINTN